MKSSSTYASTQLGNKMTKCRIVVLGSGISGLSAAYTSAKHNDNDDVEIILLESSNNLGGHACTINVKDETGKSDVDVDVDIGFQVMNKLTYPNLLRLFQEIGMAVEPTDMSFSIFDNNAKDDYGESSVYKGWSFQSNYTWLLNNFYKPRLHQFMKTHGEFAAVAKAYLANPVPIDLTIRQLTEKHNVDQNFIDNWLLPFISAVWSAPVSESLDFAALPLLKFLHHHMFLTMETVQWLTPHMRSINYVKRISSAKVFTDNVTVKLGCKAVEIDTTNKTIMLESGEKVYYDKLIMTCAAPVQAALLRSKPSNTNDACVKKRVEWLSEFGVNYQRVAVHNLDCDMPSDKKDWCAWNVKQDSSSNNGNSSGSNPCQVTYWTSKLQNLKDQRIFVTLNPDKSLLDKLQAGECCTNIDGGQTFPVIYHETSLAHPIMDTKAFKAQRSYHKVMVDTSVSDAGKSIFHAGAWLRHGFHEDGVWSGILSARLATQNNKIAIELPCLSGIDAEPILGKTTHVRYTPTVYQFEHNTYMHHFDIRTPPRDGFHRNDHFGDLCKSLDTCVRQEILDRLDFWALGKITTVCHLRYSGLCFNPITPYYVHDEFGTLVAILVEVHNTPWGERQLYAMNVAENNVLSPCIHPKQMHVSPFNPPPNVDPNYEYQFAIDAKQYLCVDVYKCDKKDSRRSLVIKASLDMPSSEKNAQSNIIKPQHDVRYGSWLALFHVYYHAIVLLFYKKVDMHAYDVKGVSSTSSVENPIEVSKDNAEEYMVWLLKKSHMVFYAALPCLTILISTVFGTGLEPMYVHINYSSLLMYAVAVYASYKFHLRRRVDMPSLFLGVFFTALVFGRMLVYSLLHGNFFGGFGYWSTGAACLYYVGCFLENAQDKRIIHSKYIFANAVLGFVFTTTHICPLVGNVHFAVLMMGVTLCYVKCVHMFQENRCSIDVFIANVMNYAIAHMTDGQVMVQYLPGSNDDVITLPVRRNNNNRSVHVKYMLLKDPRKVLASIISEGGDLGLGESYVRGEWDIGSDTELEEVLMLLANNYEKIAYLSDTIKYINPSWWLRKWSFMNKFCTLDKTQSKNSIAEHYDDGNELFRSFLGDDMVYTSGLFKPSEIKRYTRTRAKEAADVLAAAQRRKVDRMIELANEAPVLISSHHVDDGSEAVGDKKLLDIGCGWGFLTNRALENNWNATGICNCKSMIQKCKEKYTKGTFLECDYRDLDGGDHVHQYDAITCVEMIEAVPQKHYRIFADECSRLLKPGGRVVMQVINAFAFNNPTARSKDSEMLGTFVTTHIFPGQQIPYMEYLYEAFLENGNFVRTHNETSNIDYAMTLAAWKYNLEQNKDRFPESVVRKYRYYLAWCEAGFENNLLHVSRIAFDKI